MPKPFVVITGQFPCQKCDNVADNLRMWKDTKDLTWQCEDKHISKVSLDTKKGRNV